MGRTLGRKTKHRTAIFRNRAVSLLTHPQITTTVPNATAATLRWPIHCHDWYIETGPRAMLGTSTIHEMAKAGSVNKSQGSDQTCQAAPSAPRA